MPEALRTAEYDWQTLGDEQPLPFIVLALALGLVEADLWPFGFLLASIHGGLGGEMVAPISGIEGSNRSSLRFVPEVAQQRDVRDRRSLTYPVDDGWYGQRDRSISR